jgi:hypothetical protein
MIYRIIQCCRFQSFLRMASLLALLLLAISTAAVPLDLAQGNCVHKFPVVDELPHPVYLEPSGRLVKRSLEHQLRIKVFYHETVEKLPKSKRKIVEQVCIVTKVTSRQSKLQNCNFFQVVPSAASYWEEVLKVRRNEATIRLNRKCENNQYFLSSGDPTQFCKNRCVETKCGEFLVPAEHLTACNTCDSDGRDCSEKEGEGKGINDVDFVLYVSAMDTKQCGGKIGTSLKGLRQAATLRIYRFMSMGGLVGLLRRGGVPEKKCHANPWQLGSKGRK